MTADVAVSFSNHRKQNRSNAAASQAAAAPLRTEL